MKAPNCDRLIEDNQQAGYMIMVACHDAEARRYFKDFLESNGLSVVETSSCENLTEKMLAINPDLVLMDAVAPGVDGFEACEDLSSNAATRQIPVIMVTDIMDPELVEWSYEVGVSDFIRFPVDETLLKYRIRHLIEKSRSEREWEELQRQLTKQLYEKTQEVSEIKVAIQEEWEAHRQTRTLLERYKGNWRRFITEVGKPQPRTVHGPCRGLRIGKDSSSNLRRLAALTEPELQALSSFRPTSYTPPVQGTLF
ncbi:MAG: response regulator [Magnetococcales bacterium]|nr:response regulator [Magnetococcales bacterium]